MGVGAKSSVCQKQIQQINRPAIGVPPWLRKSPLKPFFLSKSCYLDPVFPGEFLMCLLLEPPMLLESTHLEVSWNRVTPSSHPFLDRIFQNKNHPAMGYHHFLLRGKVLLKAPQDFLRHGQGRRLILLVQKVDELIWDSTSMKPTWSIINQIKLIKPTILNDGWKQFIPLMFGIFMFGWLSIFFTTLVWIGWEKHEIQKSVALKKWTNVCQFESSILKCSDFFSKFWCWVIITALFCGKS